MGLGWVESIIRLISAEAEALLGLAELGNFVKDIYIAYQVLLFSLHAVPNKINSIFILIVSISEMTSFELEAILDSLSGRIEKYSSLILEKVESIEDQLTQLNVERKNILVKQSKELLKSMSDTDRIVTNEHKEYYLRHLNRIEQQISSKMAELR